MSMETIRNWTERKVENEEVNRRSGSMFTVRVKHHPALWPPSAEA